MDTSQNSSLDPLPSERNAPGATTLNILTFTEVLDPTKPETELRLPGGRLVYLPTALLLNGPAGQEGTPVARTTSQSPGLEEQVIPVVEERLDVQKRLVTTGKVLLEKRVQEYHETLDVPLAVRTFDIERVVLNQPVETAPGIRHQGSTTIYPLVEEQLVITTRLVLKEEVRVTQRDEERRDTRTVTLTREILDVTRTPNE